MGRDEKRPKLTKSSRRKSCKNPTSVVYLI
nr:MAG TPA: hypothetical protein [Caudoviricetes sp.]